MSKAQFFDTPEQQSIIKTQLVAKYFGAWTKIMLPRAKGPGGAIAYVDLFSGPGEFDDGSASTPLWLLSYAIKDPALCARLITMFNDKNSNYIDQLRAKINALPGIERLVHEPIVSNDEVGPKVVDRLRSLSHVPTLFFIDPWGYKGLSLELIGNAIKHWGCDCIFFFNYNRINPGINNPFVVARMNDLFSAARADRLREKVKGLSPEERQSTIINELAEALREVGGRFVLPFEFKSRHGERTSHHIIFVSKEFLGYHLMKEVMFGLSSDDAEVRSFEYIPVKSPQLRLLFDLAKPHGIETLKNILVRSCAGNAFTVWQVYERCSVDTPYTLRNVKDAIKALEAEEKVFVDTPADKRPKRHGEVTLADKRVVTFPS